MNEPLTRALGVVTSAPGDWSFSTVLLVFSILLGTHGISAALLGKWQEQVGPRTSGALGALFFGGGIALGGLGVHLHQIWMLYLGYGFLGGLGLGLAFAPPLAAINKWFPERRGLASGLAVMGFGGGAFLASPLIQNLFQHFQKPPMYLGKIGDVNLITENGKRFAQIITDGVTHLKEVVVVSASELKATGFSGLEEGVYLVGTGSSGSTETLITLGVLYFSAMYLSAMTFKIPPPGYTPEGWTPPGTPDGTQSYVHIDNVMKIPQFWQVLGTYASFATAAIGVFAVAEPMMRDIFSTTLPGIVTSNFAGTYIMGLSAAFLLGNVICPALSHQIGNKNTLTLFTMLSVPLFATLPFCVHANSNVSSLAIFYASTFLIVSLFGGIHSVFPSFLSDLFGSKFVGTIHGRMLTAATIATCLGPIAIANLRNMSEFLAIKNLCAKVDPNLFLQTFVLFWKHSN